MSASKIALWVLMGILFVGLAGFGATNLSGTVRTVGSVGDKSISTDRYYRAIQQEMRATQTSTFAQAQQTGLPDRVLSALVTARALDHEAQEMGLSIGDDRLAQDLLQIDAFQGPDGQFDRDAYRFALQNIGMNESQFEESLRDEGARTLLQSAVLSGLNIPDGYADVLLSHALENREARMVIIDNDGLAAGVPVPSDTDLQAFYDAQIDRYTAPETRDLTYVWATPDMLLDSVDVPEADLRASYEERSSEFNLPARRLVERLVFADDTAAQDALERITSGGSSFEQEVEVRGLALSDIDLGDVTVEELDGAGDAVFAANTGEIVGPLPSDLGPALFRVNAILDAQETPFEDAIPALRQDLALDRARRVIQQLREEAEDLLAGGATLEEVASETELQLGTIGFWPGALGGIADYPAFRDIAATVSEDDFPETASLEDGGIFAVRFDGITPPAPHPFEEVRSDVERDWTQAETVAALRETAEGYVAQLEEGRTFDALELEGAITVTARRDQPVEGAAPGTSQALFEMSESEARVLDGPGSAVTLIQLTAIVPADLEGVEAGALRGFLDAQARADLSQDLFNALATDIQRRAGVQINQQAITAVNTQLGGGF